MGKYKNKEGRVVDACVCERASERALREQMRKTTEAIERNEEAII
jgi:hypothetical protein